MARFMFVRLGAHQFDGSDLLEGKAATLRWCWFVRDLTSSRTSKTHCSESNAIGGWKELI